MEPLALQLAAMKRDGHLDGRHIALLIAEDDVCLRETIAHLLKIGFRKVLVALPEGLAIQTEDSRVATLRTATNGPGKTEALVNATLAVLRPGTWFHYCYNAEFLIYPFAESRSIVEALDFHESERRHSMATFVIDVYARDLTKHRDGVDLDYPAFDGAGYFETNGQIQGGLRWRMKDAVPDYAQPLHRYALVQATAGLKLTPGHQWASPELNTLSCPWHRNLTASLISFRVAKALRRSPGFAERHASFHWPGAKTLDWSSYQLLDAGFMEVGQWF